jgi:Flp pilus assembly pilin Flp
MKLTEQGFSGVLGMRLQLKKSTRRSLLKGFALGGTTLLLQACGSSNGFTEISGQPAQPLQTLPEEIVFQFAPDTWPASTTHLEFRFLGPPTSDRSVNAQGLVEYALVLVLVNVTVVVVLNTLGPRIQNLFDEVVVDLTARSQNGDPVATASVSLATLSATVGSSFQVNVSPTEVTSITLAAVEAGPDPILLDRFSTVGVQVQLVAVFSNTDQVELSPAGFPTSATFSSGNPNVFRVDNGGLVTVADMGGGFEAALTSTYTLGGVTQTDTTPVRVGQISVVGPFNDFTIPGSSNPITDIQFTDGNAAPINVAGTSGVSYALVSPQAGVSVGPNGVVTDLDETPFASRTTTVIVTYNNGARDYVGSFSVFGCSPGVC